MCLFKEKKKLLFVVGAGASVDFGMPSTFGIDKCFDNWANNYFSIPSKTKNISLYKYLKNTIEDSYNSVSKPIKTETNFEEVLFTALNLYSINNDNKSNPLSGFYDFKNSHQIEAFGKTKDMKFNDFKSMASLLIDKLVKEFRQKCSTLSTFKTNELKLLKIFLNSIQKEFDIGVLTLNYDNIFLSQMNNPNTGFQKDGLLDANSILKGNKNWNFIYHLHGSVHFDMQSNSNDLHNITFNNDLNSEFQQNSFGRSGHTTVEEQFVLTSNIIAGYGKSYQIQKNPYCLYFTDFGRKIYEADALIFAGYGFNDDYINNIIRNSFDFNRKRPVVVLGYSKNDQDPMQFRQDLWMKNLTNTISTDAWTMSTRDHTSAPDIETIKNNKEFEISKDDDRPLSIWHNGFLEACRNPNIIIQELKR